MSMMHNSRLNDTSVCSSGGNNLGVNVEEIVDIQTFQTCSIYSLKKLIWKQVPSIPIGD